MKDNCTRTNGMCNGRKVYGWTKLAMERSLKTTGSKTENPLSGYPGGGYPLPDGLYDLLSEDMLPHSQSWWTRAWRGDRATRSNHPIHTQSNSFEGLFKSGLKVGQGIAIRLDDAACILGWTWDVCFIGWCEDKNWGQRSVTDVDMITRLRWTTACF